LDNPDFFVSVEFLYNQDIAAVILKFPSKPRPDIFSDYPVGFQIRNSAALPPNAISLLSRNNVIDYNDAGLPVREIPPLAFSHTQFMPTVRKFFSLKGDALPDNQPVQSGYGTAGSVRTGA
jgi:hypothetical protein